MKKTLSFLGMAVITLNLSSCNHWNKENTGIAVGATTGAALGGLAVASVSSAGIPGIGGVFPGIIAGGLIGGLIGGVIGHYMDRQDHAYMSQAIITTPVNETASWTNTKTNTTYHVTPIRNYKTTNNQYCREYKTTVVVDDKTTQAYGTACRNPDGSWHIMK
jgi:surface antigen